MSHFVLVHGAWHGAWCWEKVAPRLAALGHTAHAIDLPGHGNDPKMPIEVGWVDYMGRMREVIGAAPEPPILVGHSLGGAVITGAADRWPERIRSLVYLCAMLPFQPDLASLIDPGALLGGAVRRSDDGRLLHVEPGAVRDVFYHDCADEDAARAAARLCPQSVAVFEMRFELLPERYGSLPRHYIECLDDHAIPLAIQRAMHGNMPCKIHALEASHSPFYSMPEALAGLLDGIARES